jgi:hypothetical protein
MGVSASRALAAETVRENPSSPREQLLEQKNILERIVVRDES